MQWFTKLEYSYRQKCPFSASQKGLSKLSKVAMGKDAWRGRGGREHSAFASCQKLWKELAY